MNKKSLIKYGVAALALLMPLLLIFAVAVAIFGRSVDLKKALVSDKVKAYAGLIQAYAMEQGIPEYSGLIISVMMQESGGHGNDPMQAAESGFNTKYQISEYSRRHKRPGVIHRSRCSGFCRCVELGWSAGHRR